jgi:GNAT superfamily N-acetyltransferase
MEELTFKASLFSEYIKELGLKEIIEDEDGFATFYAFDNGLYIEDIFVTKEERRNGKASYYADHIAALAKERGFDRIYGSVKPSAKTSTTATKILFAYGFKLHSAGPDAILFVKEI